MELTYAAVLGFLAASVINIDFHFREITEKKFSEYFKCFYGRISYILNEILISGVFIGLCYYYSLTYRFVIYAFLFVLLVMISNYDIRYQSISNDLIIICVAVGLLLLPVNKDCAIWDYLGSLIFYFSAFYGISNITHGAIGKGDAFILGIIGIFLGFLHTLAVLLYAVMLGGVIILVLFMLRVISRKTSLPFAPFLTLGFIVSILL